MPTEEIGHCLPLTLKCNLMRRQKEITLSVSVISTLLILIFYHLPSHACPSALWVSEIMCITVAGAFVFCLFYIWVNATHDGVRYRVR